MSGAVDQRRHVGRVEPVDVVVLVHLVAGGDRERRRERLEVIVALLADLEVQDHAAVRLGVVVVPVLAVEVARDVAQLLPGPGRRRQVVAVLRLERLLVLGIGQSVPAVVQHLAVGVVQHAVGRVFPVMQRLQRRRHGVIGPLRVLVRCHQLVDRVAVAGRRDVAVPERADHEGIVLAGAVAQIEHHLRIVLAERQLDDVELAAGQLLPDRPEGVQRAGDAALGTAGVDGHRDLGALERLLVGPEQGAQLLAGGGDHRVVVVRAEHQIDRAVVVPAHVLRRGAGRHQRDRRRAEKPALQNPLGPKLHGKAPSRLDPATLPCRRPQPLVRGSGEEARITRGASVCPLAWAPAWLTGPPVRALRRWPARAPGRPCRPGSAPGDRQPGQDLGLPAPARAK